MKFSCRETKKRSVEASFITNRLQTEDFCPLPPPAGGVGKNSTKSREKQHGELSKTARRVRGDSTESGASLAACEKKCKNHPVCLSAPKTIPKFDRNRGYL